MGCLAHGRSSTPWRAPCLGPAHIIGSHQSVTEDSEQEPANKPLARHAGHKQDHGKAGRPATSISQTDKHRVLELVCLEFVTPNPHKNKNKTKQNDQRDKKDSGNDVSLILQGTLGPRGGGVGQGHTGQRLQQGSPLKSQV